MLPSCFSFWFIDFSLIPWLQHQGAGWVWVIPGPGLPVPSPCWAQPPACKEPKSAKPCLLHSTFKCILKRADVLIHGSSESDVLGHVGFLKEAKDLINMMSLWSIAKQPSALWFHRAGWHRQAGRMHGETISRSDPWK
jgi:hypothetical protein